MAKPKIKILSIDGGGIRGIIPCAILRFLEEQLGSLSNKFDLFSGTSTGGIIACGLNTKNPLSGNTYSANDLLDLYDKEGSKIFNKRESDLKSSIASFFFKNNIPDELLKRPYEIDGLEQILFEKFRNSKLSEAENEILITTFDINKNRPFYFSSRLAKTKNKEDFLIRDIARSTSAAPTFFKPYSINNAENGEYAFIDGGIFANNPSILAYCEAKEIWKEKTTKGFNPKVQPTDDDLPFFMLSISTGVNRASIDPKIASKWSTYEWIDPLVKNLLTQGVSDSTHHAMQHLLPDYADGSIRYKRIEVQLPPEGIKMDDASPENIKLLKSIAENYIIENEKELMTIVNILK